MSFTVQCHVMSLKGRVSKRMFLKDDLRKIDLASWPHFILVCCQKQALLPSGGCTPLTDSSPESAIHLAILKRKALFPWHSGQPEITRGDLYQAAINMWSLSPHSHEDLQLLIGIYLQGGMGDRGLYWRLGWRLLCTVIPHLAISCIVLFIALLIFSGQKIFFTENKKKYGLLAFPSSHHIHS